MKPVDDIINYCEQIRGKLDALEAYAGELNESAAKAKGKSDEYKGLCEQVSEKKAELAAREAELDTVKKAYKAFQALAAHT